MKNFIRQPLPATLEAAETLKRAVDSHLSGAFADAERHFKSADQPAIRDWSCSFWDKRWRETVAPSLPGLATPIPVEDRDPLRMPTRAMEDDLIERDGYICRFCATPVVPAQVRQRATQRYPNAVPWGRKSAEQHAAFQAMLLNFDHIVPHSRGGQTTLDNLVVACSPCNLGRGNFTLEEVFLSDPRQRPPVASEWTGLVEFSSG